MKRSFNALMVPIHLDGLWLRQDTSVLDPMADFTRLPYSDSDCDVNPNVAYISEEILSRPFEDCNFNLKAGLHLHWALPDAMTKGVNQELLFEVASTFCCPGLNGKLTTELKKAFIENGILLSDTARAIVRPVDKGDCWMIKDPMSEGTYTLRSKGERLKVYGNQIVFPSVPNRWLIRRSVGSTVEQWIVESDYLHPPETTEPCAITYPVQNEANPQPFRYLGRQLNRDDWNPFAVSESPKLYLKKLTAIGHGDPNFHAFYPNCHSVFGCYDPTPPTGKGKIRYDVIGWFSEPGQDNLKTLAFEEAIDAVMAKYNLSEKTNEVKFETLAEQYNWQVARENGLSEEDSDWWSDLKDEVFPESTVCYARINIDPDTFDYQDPAISDKPQNFRVAIGNTGTEALSAYLADQLEGNNVIIEDQLEALHLANHLKGQHLDIGATFKEARHSKQYTALRAGTIWTVVPAETTQTDSAPAPLESHIAHLLNQLNQIQVDFDLYGHEITSLRRQLFADWYKYMICAYPPEDQIDDYPDIDEVKFFIENNSLKILECKVVTRQEQESLRDEKLAELNQALRKSITAQEDKKLKYVIKPTSAPRYWQPNDPVVLLGGNSIQPTLRHGEDGMLKCRLQSLPDADIVQHLDLLLDTVAEIAQNSSTGLHNSDKQPWHPFLLEWCVDVLPLSSHTNLDPSDPAYDVNFIANNFKFPEYEPDLALRQRQADVRSAANRYTGRSTLLTHAKSSLRSQLEVYLQVQLLPAYYQSHNIALKNRTNDYFEQHCEKICAWYEALKEQDENKDEVLSALLKIYRQVFIKKDEIDNPDFCCMTQTLTGFNEALLMHKQTRQLPIDDPLGFETARAFTHKVNAAVKRETRSAPQPLDDFNPVRSGLLKLAEMRLVDTFGRVLPIEFEKERLITAESMAVSADNYQHCAYLPPRFVQPTRLNFRWLSADANFTKENDEPEMNSHPASSPLCGWILPNHLDRRLMIYAANGRALGSIDAEGQWRSAPGAARISPWEVPNPHLGRLIMHLIKHEKMGDFLDRLETHQNAIDPENFAEHQVLSLLLGQPLAVARASLNLQLAGLPALNEDWNAFQRDMHRSLNSESGEIELRENDHFTKVKIPLRLGAHNKQNDGLVAFWEEHWAAKGQCKYVEQKTSGTQNKGAYVRFSDESTPLMHSLSDPAITTTLLLDPRASVHAATGILPTKSITIPSDQYAAALKRISVTFLTAPLITSVGKITLPLPEEPGYRWSWVEKEHSSWSELDDIGSPENEPNWGAKQEIVEGWLKLEPHSDD